MKKSEYEACAKAGVKNVIEVPIGIDGLTFIEANGAQPLNLTQADIYKALAANPFGKGPNTAQTWKDVNPALPAVKIRVLGPPPTSGTRDSLAELYLTKGCESDPAMKELKKSDEDKHKDICTKVREDGAFVEAGENDNLLVQKVTADPGTLGVLGYSYPRGECRQGPPGADRRRRSDRGDDQPTSPTPARASSTSTSRASTCRPSRQLTRLRRRLRQGVGQGRAARAHRPGPVRRRRRRPRRPSRRPTLKPLDRADAEVSERRRAQ